MEERDVLMEKVAELLRMGSSVVLHGESGVGKRTLVEDAAQLAGVKLLEIDLMSMIANSTDCEEFQSKLQEALRKAQADNVVAYLAHVEQLKVFEDGGCYSLFGKREGCSHRLLNDVCELTGKGMLRCIATTTAYSVLRRVSAFYAWFEPVEITEMEVEDCIRSLSRSSEELKELLGTPVDDEAIRAAVVLSSTYFPRQKLPAKAVELLQDVATAGPLCSMDSVVTQVSQTTQIAEDQLLMDLNVVGISLQEVIEEEKETDMESERHDLRNCLWNVSTSSARRGSAANSSSLSHELEVKAPFFGRFPELRGVLV